MASRKERLDQLVEHARKILADNPNFDRQTIYQELEEYIIKEWQLGWAVRKDYIDSVSAILKEELAKRDSEVGFFADPSAVSKDSLILRTIDQLGYQKNNEAEERQIMEVLNKSHEFHDEIDIKKHFHKLNRAGLIFEKRPGYWSKA